MALITSELLFSALMFIAAAVLTFMLRRWQSKLPAGGVAATFLVPVRHRAQMFLFISALYGLLRAYGVFVGVALPEHLIHVVLVLVLSVTALSVPYSLIGVAAVYSRDLDANKKYPWSQYARIYQLPARIAILAVFGLIVLQATGFDIQAVLVAGGIGGLVAGFALKEILADLFSGISLQATPMLNPGDVIRLSERNIEGTITDIGFRMTRLMTFERRTLLLPNSIITTAIIENLSQIQSRRIQFVVGVRYDDYRTVKNIVSQLREQLPARPSMVDQQSSLIYFREFGAHSLNIQIRIFTSKTDYGAYCLELEDVLHHTASIVERNGAEFAFPTSVVHLQGAPDDGPRPRPSPPIGL